MGQRGGGGENFSVVDRKRGASLALSLGCKPFLLIIKVHERVNGDPE